MVSLLLRKLLRDIRKSGMTYVVCILIVASGFCGYSVLSLAMDQLSASRDHFLTITNFPAAFITVEQAPKQQSERLLQNLDGVRLAEGRLAHTVRLAGAGENAPELRLVSISSEGQAVPLLTQGQLPFSGDSEREIVLGNGFFQAHDLSMGSELALVIQGRVEYFTISGSGSTPENIYMIKNFADLLPSPADYDAAFIEYETMARLFGRQGLANEFMLQLDANTDFETLKVQIEELMKPYGCYSVYLSQDQASVAMLNTEIEQVGKMATVVPFLFLMVAAVVLYITLYRLIEQQRVQAGTLMSLGFARRRILTHYLGYGLFTGFAGGVLGGILGVLAARPMVEFYRAYFSLPNYHTPLSWGYMLVGVIVASVFCGLVGWMAARNLAQLLPAEALRPAAPKAARTSLLERIPRAVSVFTVPGLMALRGIARNRRRSFLAIVGIACAFMITATLVSMSTLFDVFLFNYLEDTQRQDITISFDTPLPTSTALAAMRHEDVEHAEGFLQFPATLRGPSGEIECTVQAIAEDSQLVQLFDAGGQQIYAPAEGIVISEHMANLLGVNIGDTLESEVAYPQKRIARTQVTGIMAQYIGGTAYMSYAAAADISDYRGVASGVLLKAPEQTRLILVERLATAHHVSLIESRLEKLAKMHSMMGNMSAIMGTMATMGVIVGFAVIYTSSLISFEELKREIATLMMLGLPYKQCLEVISVGQWLLTLIAFIPGIILTLFASKSMSTSFASDLYTIPSFVEGSSLIFAICLTLVSVFFSSRVMLRKIRKLSPVDLLRERE